MVHQFGNITKTEEVSPKCTNPIVASVYVYSVTPIPGWQARRDRFSAGGSLQKVL